MATRGAPAACTTCLCSRACGAVVYYGYRLLQLVGVVVRRWSAATTSHVVVIGALAGLATATKYNGLLALATVGLVFGWHLLRGPSRARVAPPLVYVLWTLGAWSGWVIPQEPRYVLFVLPPLVVSAAVGLAWLVRRRAPVAGRVASVALAGLVGLCNLYLCAFATGRL